MEALAILGVYGVSYVLVNKTGPYNVLERLQSRFSVFNCIPCISFWLSIPITLIFGLPVYYFLGIWGAVVLLDKVMSVWEIK